MNKQQGGFTLIELVMVIVILGILAATALPRFSNLSSQARYASLQGLTGSLRSAAAIAHATSLAQNASAGQSISMEGQTVTMTNYYPTADAAGIGAAIQDSTGFTASGSPIAFTPTGATAGSCTVTYTAAPSTTSSPSFTVVGSNSSC